MNRELINRYRALCDAARTHTTMLIEFGQEPGWPNMICFLRRVGDDILAFPVATMLAGEQHPFKIEPAQLQPLDPRRN